MGILVGDPHIKLNHMLEHLRRLALFLGLLLRLRSFSLSVCITMAVICVNECLEVAHLDQLPTVLLALNQRVHLHRVIGVLGQQLLDHLVVK